MAKIQEYDVIIIGGGVTGAGVARDCSLRGLSVLTIERKDIADGATGRNHGLLHSGARYAVGDMESASECISENKILKKIASACCDDTGGLFISLPEDDEAYRKTFLKSCKKAGIKARELDSNEALEMEPAANPSLTGAVWVPDGSVDPFRLSASNFLDAQLHGARLLTRTEVISFIKENGRVCGVEVFSHTSGSKMTFRAKIVVNAAGIWGQRIASLAGAEITMFPAKGSLLVFAHRLNNMVLNRLRKPDSGDILVPGETVTIIGTTSERVPYEEIDSISPAENEVDLLLREGVKLCPSIASARVLRAYCGVRPLVAQGNDKSGRNISRGIVLIDHGDRDGIDGFVTISGGKLMTYRLMAEKTADLICDKLGVNARCMTAANFLPGSTKDSLREVGRKIWAVPTLAQKVAADRFGTMAAEIFAEEKADKSLVCECEEVSYSEIKRALKSPDTRGLNDIRRRTRMGMGTCQGELCASRAACALAREKSGAQEALMQLASYMQERWKGIKPVAWGESLREAEFTQWVYKEVYGL